MKLLLIAGWMSFVTWSAARALAEEVHCPNTISVKQSLVKTQLGWKEGTSGQPIRLAGVTFFDGPPEQKASLVYDDEKLLNGKQIASWQFLPQSRIWLSCRYSGSVIVLSRALSTAASKCRVTYNPKETVDGLPLLEKIECE